MKKIPVTFLALMLGGAGFAQQADSIAASAMVGKMTLQQKIDLVVGMGMNLPGISSQGGTGVGMIKDKVPGAAGTTYAIPGLGLPGTVVADGPAGLRIDPTRSNDSNTYYATAWPVATLLASSWDTKLVQQVGEAMGNEVKEYGVDVLLGPGMNIQRNPLGARNFEYYAEDPLLSGKMAAAMVKGIQSNGVGTSIKHFVANNQETNRNSVNVVVSERALREIYLKGFEIAVKEAKPWTVMSSYNKLNGTYTSEEYDLLTTILRKEWGFKGMVMTDWFGGRDAVAQMKAGNDLLMPGTPDQKKAITEAVATGKLDTAVLNENAVRIVRYVMGAPAFKKYTFSNKPDLKAHAAIARKAAAEGMILLKNNEQAMPIATNKKIAAFGITSYDFVSGGTGSGDVNEAYTISLVQGLANAGYKLDEQLTASYQSYVNEEKAKQPKKNFFEEFVNPTPRVSEMSITPVTFEKAAMANDVALITIGRNAGEGKDRKVENDFNLKESEQELLEQVSKAFHAQHKKVVVIINAGGVIEVASWRDKVDAILLAWQPGLEAGNAVADVLDGKVNPSGRLATTFPVKYTDDISAKNFPGKEFPDKAYPGMFGMKQVPAEVVYDEGIYVGYRYYNTFNVQPAYEFGYGLSYTNFTFSNIKLSRKDLEGRILVSVTVTNTGNVSGREVVQLYVGAPSGKLQQPAEELRGFYKTLNLHPGQKQIATFEINAADIASYDAEGSQWITAAGTYQVKVGASSKDIRLTGDFTVANDIITEKCHKVLAPQTDINELKK